MHTRSVRVFVFLLSALALTLSACAPSARRDDCLQGTWTMRTGDLDLLLATLVPLSNLRVTDGQLQLIFDGDMFTYQAESFTVHIDVGPNMWMEANAGFVNSGTFSTAGGKIFFESGGSSTQVLTWRAFADGVEIAVPGGGPQFDLPLPGAAPYTCSDHYLQLESLNSGGTTITMLFER